MPPVLFPSPSRQEEDPPPITHCDYSVRVEYGVYRCMTVAEYQDYRSQEPGLPVWLGVTLLTILAGVLVVVLYMALRPIR